MNAPATPAPAAPPVPRLSANEAKIMRWLQERTAAGHIIHIRNIRAAFPALPSFALLLALEEFRLIAFKGARGKKIELVSSRWTTR